MKRSLLEMLVCPIDLARLESFEFGKDSEEIEEGILHCSQCRRWYPILEGIPRLLPDQYRGESEVELLRRQQNRLPEEIVRNGKPFNLLTTHVSPAAPDDKPQIFEMELRNRSAMKSLRPASPHKAAGDCISLIKAETVLRLLQPQGDDRILDVGIGQFPLYVQKLLSRGTSIVGVDFSIVSLKVCQQLGYPWRENLHLVQGHASHLPVASDTCNKVISSQLIQHLPSAYNRATAFQEMERVTRPGGVFLLETLNEHSFTRLFRRKENPSDYGKKRPYLYLYNKSELLEEISSSFEDVRVCGIYNFYPVYIMWRRLFKGNLSNRYLARLDLFISRFPLASHWAGALVAKCKRKRISLCK